MKSYTSILAPLVLFAFGAQAQSITVLSSGGDARACSFAAEMSGALKPSRSDLDPCDRALGQMHLARRDRAATFVNRGILRARLEQYQGALDDYNEALQIEDELPQAWNGKGNLYYLAQRYDEAIAAYERALALELPERHVAHYNLGLVHQQLGDRAAAERSYSTALELSPDWEAAKTKLEQLK